MEVHETNFNISRQWKRHGNTEQESHYWLGFFTEGFIEGLRLKVSSDGGAGFEVTEKTGTSKDRNVEPGRVECIVWRVGDKRQFIEPPLDARPFHIFLSFPHLSGLLSHLTDKRTEAQRV